MRARFLVSMGLLVVALAGCGRDSSPPVAIYVPDGDVARGRAAFIALQCNACHTVAGIEMPPPVADPPVGVALGGEVARPPTKGELYTAIIQPSHELASGYAVARAKGGGVSRMGDYSETLTVRQLFDLVAFLQSRYEVAEHLSFY